jgi:hypothetical protein
MLKGHEVSLFIYNMQPEFLSITYKMDINCDGMGPFMLTNQFPSSSKACTMLVLIILESCVDSQLFLSNMIQINVTTEPTP